MNKTILTAVLLTACISGAWAQQNSKGYTVSGEIADSAANGKTIYIQRYDDMLRVDSTVVRNNRFCFRGEVDEPAYCRIQVLPRKHGNIILEPGNIRVNLEHYNQPSGTPMNDEMRRLQLREDSISKQKSMAYKAFQQQFTDVEELKQKGQAWLDEFRKERKAEYKELYKQHLDDAVGYFLLYTKDFDLLSDDEKLELLASFGPWLKGTRTVQRAEKQIRQQKETAVGSMFVDVKGVDADGRPIALSDFIGKGNYVLLDMWASWCGPCRGETPNLATLHNKYKDKGLTVLGVFVWDKMENLKKAMEEEKIDWPQMFDSGKEMTTRYGVDGIPHIILFGPDGTILHRGLRGVPMIETVSKIMEKK